MPGRTRIACLIAALAVAGVGAAGAHAVTMKRLNYETGDFLQWTALQAVPGDATIVRSPVRQGRFAARFIVRSGDRPIGGTAERAEVYTETREREGTNSWWTWSTYFPRSFTRGGGPIFTQWHQSGSVCTPPVIFVIVGSRPAKLRLQVWGGRLDENTCLNPSRRGWNFAKLRRNHWYNFRFHVKWSSRRSIGFVKLWVNGHVRVPKTHTATLYEGQGVYLKQGLMRSPSPLATTIYHDGARRFQP